MELIDKDKLIKTIQQIPCWECKSLRTEYDECYSCIMERVVDAPAVDAVSVVRCNDCKRAMKYEYGVCCCATLHPTKLDGFCHHGERKEVQE